MIKCDNCDAVDVHGIEISELEPLVIQIPHHQKIKLVTPDGQEVVQVMNQSGDIIVWLENEAITEIIETTPEVPSGFVVLRLAGKIESLHGKMEFMCFEHVSESDPAPADEDAELGWRTVVYVNCNDIQEVMKIVTERKLELV